jgi:hypothetical protein
LPSGVIAMSAGSRPTLTGGRALLVAVRIGVAGQQHRRPLQRALTRHDEPREPFGFGIHGTSGRFGLFV